MRDGPGTSTRKPAEILDRRACLERLGSIAIGRVAWTTSSGAVVALPVNFVLDDETIVFGTGRGDKLTAVQEGRRISFEADDVEKAVHTGWSVLVTGTAEVVESPQQMQRIAELHLDTWDLLPDPCYVRLRIDEVTGRRLPLHPGGVTSERIEG